MNLALKILTEPSILIIVAVFLVFFSIVYANYLKIKNTLNSIVVKLRQIDKKEVSYRFHEIDNFMREVKITSSVWDDFKKALIFTGNLYTPQNNTDSNNIKSDIFLTIDASYFFNEETLILSNLNAKFIQTMPTIITGLGPFFTFLKMAIAFTSIDFSNTEIIETSLNNLLTNIQIAALCSVFAVGFSLLFMFLEKILYNRMCRQYSLEIQKEFIRLFDIVTSEKFLVDILKESKLQSISTEKLLKNLPSEFVSGISKILTDSTIPYLENILFGINNINNSINKNNNGGADLVDKLF